MDEMDDRNVDKITTIQQAIASCFGAIITSFFAPLDVIKIRLQAQSNPFSKGKCFIYSNGLMDHICVCENGDSKAWYKKPGHFKGTLVPAHLFRKMILKVITFKDHCFPAASGLGNMRDSYDNGYKTPNVQDAFVKIIQIEGIKSLWSGLAPTLIMALPTTVIYFTCYDQLSEALKSRLGKDDDHIPVLAGSLSRFGSVTLVSPLELIRTRVQSRRLSYQQLYLRVRSEVARQGWLSLWRGWSSTLLRDVPFSAIYWYNYERFKKMMCEKVGAHESTFFIAFTSGAASGSIAAVITLPFDVVKTHRQTELWERETLKTPQRNSTSMWAVLRRIVAENGVTGLFAGIVPRLIKVAPACAIMISTYEYGKSFFRHLNEKKNQHP